MHGLSTMVDRENEKPVKIYRAGDQVGNLRSGINDLNDSFAAKHLWLEPAWRDVYLRYVNSKLGPLWITISMGVFIACFSVIGSTLFNISLHDYLPFLTIGIIVWVFISSTIIEGSDVFVSYSHIILDQRTPLLAIVFRLLLRGSIIFAHNALICIIVLLIFPAPIGPEILISFVGLLILLVFLTGTVLITATMSTKYRDLPQLLVSLLQVSFFLTPIMWNPETILRSGRRYIVDINPFYHFLEVIRNPLLGKSVSIVNISVATGTATFAAVLGWIIFIRYRRRITYWL